MIHITEPVRKSALDVIRYNLYAAGCVSFNICIKNDNNIETCNNTRKKSAHKSLFQNLHK